MKQNKAKEHGDEYFDGVFANMQKEIIKKRDTSNTKRFNPQNTDNNNNKFTMHINDNTKIANTENEKPFMDMFSENMMEESITANISSMFMKFMEHEQYDTDAFITDIVDYGKGSNILNHIRNQQFQNYIKQYAQELNSTYISNIFHISDH